MGSDDKQGDFSTAAISLMFILANNQYVDVCPGNFETLPGLLITVNNCLAGLAQQASAYCRYQRKYIA